ncbi:THO complex subunit 4D-like [Lolium rigidum]|uniref:THO complex subunit 4D-like n=1 Tax=Lolium rigidum TaxID=89674 RepID=UPI001F5D1E0F|nr:THO complex subunit 4D-like [Lolium rigidum]
METSLDMSLDDMIKNRSVRGRGRGRIQRGGRGRGDGQRSGRGDGQWLGRGDGQRLGRGLGRGRGAGTFRGRGVPSQRPLGVNTRSSSYAIAKSFNKTKDFAWTHDRFEDSMVAAGLSGIETGTKLYISNLHYGVTKEDLQELFSEMGHLKNCAVHYDNNRHPTGTAEVIFTRRSEAVQALKRYNNVRLDGKEMKIEVIGANLGLAAVSAPRVSVVPGARGRGQREVVMMSRSSGFGGGAADSSNFLPGWKRNGFSQRGGQARGRGRGRGRSFGRGRGRGRAVYVLKGSLGKSVDQLDKELDTYHSGAMNVD